MKDARQIKRSNRIRWTLPLFAFTAALIGGGCVADLERVTMPDGVALGTRVYQPAEGAGPWPTLLYRTPYDELFSRRFQDLANRGYAVVVQNTRGRIFSEGSDLFFASDGWGAQRDGLETVRWILDQPWSDGRVGGFGSSASAVTQHLLAGANPPNMAAQWIQDGSANLYDGTVFQGGAFRAEQILRFLQDNRFSQENFELLDAHPEYSALWEQYDMTRRQHLRNYPVVSYSGWYDTFLEPTIKNFQTLRADGGPIARAESKLIIGLFAHAPNQGAIPWPQEAAGPPLGYARELFLDHYVRDLPNGYDTLPPVAYYLMGALNDPAAPGNTWQFAEDWPPPAIDTPLFLNQNGALTLEPPEAALAFREYVYDPRNPVPTLGGANLVESVGNHDQRPIESRDDVLVFETTPLDAPAAITGLVRAVLHITSDRPDTDFTVKLSDVYPDGRSILLCDGVLRVRYRNSFSEPELMTPGTVYEIAVDVGSTAIVFNAGHRIRVAISSSNAPRFAPNPNTGAAPSIHDPVNPVSATNRIHMDASRPSAIILPVAQ